MPVGKPRVTARDKLLGASLNLFLERGYNATSVDEICAQAGVSKGSFYHFFDSKEDLGLAALDAYYRRGVGRLLSGPFNQENDPLKRLFSYLKQTEELCLDFWGRGCLMGSFAVDLAVTHPSIRLQVADRFEQLTREISSLFEPLADPDGGHPTAFELAEGYLEALQGSIVLAQAFEDPDRIRRALQRFRSRLEASLPLTGNPQPQSEEQQA